jgi:prephenate dehydratase
MTEVLTFATQGGEFSYHAVAAQLLMGSEPMKIEEHTKFGDVVRASRNYHPGLGVIAISTVAGTVDASAKEIVRKRPSALPPIVGRVDVPIELALFGSSEQSIEQLNRRGVKCLAQKPAAQQCSEFLNTNLPWIKVSYRGESTRAVQEALATNSPNAVAIGPMHAASALGGVVLGGSQINPQGSITSFYALQRDPRQRLLPIDPQKTEEHSVVSLAHPEGEGEFTKCVKQAEKLGVEVSRFIPFDIGDYSKHNSGLRRGGGLLELKQGPYDAELTEFCAGVNGLRANDGVVGAFTTKRLGSYAWFPIPSLDLEALAVQQETANAQH